MKTFKIITDSLSDLPNGYAEQHDVTVIPVTYTLNGIEYPDTHEDVANAEYYDQIRKGAVPVTSQINESTYLETWAPFLEAGIPIVHAAFSSGLSGTANSGRLARETALEKYPNAQIYVIDTLCAALGFGFLIMRLVELRDNETSADHAVAWIEENKHYVNHWVTLDTLKYLKRGGRVSASAAFFGNMLDIKPIISINDEGKLVAREKVKGRKNSLKKLAEIFSELAIRGENELVGIGHADAPADCDYLASLLKERGVKEVITSRIGTTIGCHTGPDTISVFFFGPKNQH